MHLPEVERINKLWHRHTAKCFTEIKTSKHNDSPRMDQEWQYYVRGMEIMESQNVTLKCHIIFMELKILEIFMHIQSSRLTPSSVADYL